MTKLEHFEFSHRAMERSACKSRQSLIIYEASQKMIMESIRLMDAMRRPLSVQNVSSE